MQHIHIDMQHREKNPVVGNINKRGDGSENSRENMKAVGK